MTTTPTGPRAADPVLVALADAHPHLNAIRWRVRFSDGTQHDICGEREQVEDSRVLRFTLDDGTVTEYGPGEWLSAMSMPGKPAPNLKDITYRLLMFGLIDSHEFLNRGAWLQAQPEWIAAERAALADQPEALASAEAVHRMRMVWI